MQFYSDRQHVALSRRSFDGWESQCLSQVAVFCSSSYALQWIIISPPTIIGPITCSVCIRRGISNCKQRVRFPPMLLRPPRRWRLPWLQFVFGLVPYKLISSTGSVAGPIPVQLAELSALTYLRLDANHLWGELCHAGPVRHYLQLPMLKFCVGVGLLGVVCAL